MKIYYLNYKYYKQFILKKKYNLKKNIIHILKTIIIIKNNKKIIKNNINF